MKNKILYILCGLCLASFSGCKTESKPENNSSEALINNNTPIESNRLNIMKNPSDTSSDLKITEWKAEILKVEEAFAEMVKQEGIPKAFLAFADEKAVLNRNGETYEGKSAIQKYYEENSLVNRETTTVVWKPDFIDVSSSGDLGYTYGKYQYDFVDDSGVPQTLTGTFHTVWKRQNDGSWKYVWD